jgi:hypothetical protein
MMLRYDPFVVFAAVLFLGLLIRILPKWFKRPASQCYRSMLPIAQTIYGISRLRRYILLFPGNGIIL